MKKTSLQFGQQTWKDWHGNKKAMPSAIQEIAGAFVDLQDERYAADHDNHEQWAATDVKSILKIAHLAFQHWASIRTDPMAGNCGSRNSAEGATRCSSAPRYNK